MNKPEIKKNKKTIIIIAAAVVVAAAVAVLIIGFATGRFGSIGKGKEDYSVSCQYDESGKIVMQEDYYNKRGKLEYKVVKGYSDEAKSILMQETYVDADGNTFKIINYDEAGTIMSVDEYNKNAQLVVQHEYLEGKDTGKYFEYEYNDAGQIICTTEYDKDKNVLKKIQKEYDAKGNITLYYETDGSGAQLSKTVYTYNDKGQEIKTVFYDAHGETGYVEYEYDSEGRKTRMNEYVDGRLNNYRTYTYYENGAVKEDFHQVELTNN